MARPKKTTAELPKNWKALALKEFRVGASKQEVKALLGISNDLWTRLLKEDKEFSETIEEGVSYAEAWLLKLGRTYLTKPGLNVPVYRMQLMNRGLIEGPDKAAKQKPGFSLVEILDKAKRAREELERGKGA